MRYRVLLCASIAAAIATLTPATARANPLFYDYMDSQFGLAGAPFLGDTFSITPLQAPGLLPVYQMKVGDTVSITAADGDVFDYNVALLTNSHADFIASFYQVGGGGAAGGFVDTASLLAGRTILWSLVRRKPLFEPNGVAIDLSRETGVRIEIEALGRALNEKAPDEVYVVPVANAAVLDRGDRRIMLRL